MKTVRFQFIQFLILITVAAFAPLARAGKFPEGFSVLPSSVSPDGRFGVIVPDDAHYKVGVAQNQLVETATGRVIAVIEAETGMEHMNHGGARASWSKDGSLLHWEVAGKWFPRAKVLTKMNDGKVLWQTNVLDQAQREILARARKAKPANYAAAMKANKGNGSAYPDGFTVNVESTEDGKSPTLPFSVLVTLTSNPKGIEDFPKGANLDAEMKCTVDAAGKFKVLQFTVNFPK